MTPLTVPAKVSVLPARPAYAPGESRSRYAYNWGSVCLAASVAAAAITIYMLTVPRLLGIEEMDIGITVGALVDSSDGPLAYVNRLSWHIGNGLAYVFIYAAVLRYAGIQSTIGTGIALGVVLWLTGPMTSIPLALELFPQVASGALTNPGVFMLKLGAGLKPAAIDLGAHLVHGILAGAIYKHHVR